jgi:nitroreductase
MEKTAVTEYSIHPILHNRWSPLAYAPEPVPPDALYSLFEAARWAPSSGNLQPWSFVVVTRQDAEAHARFSEILMGNNRVWAPSAPVLLLAVAQMERKPGVPNTFALYDLGQAVANLSMQASALGLSMRQMGGFDREKARELFEIPAGYEPVTAIALGYHGSPEDLPEDLRGREMQARTRKPLADFVFHRRWGQV